MSELRKRPTSSAHKQLQDESIVGNSKQRTETPPPTLLANEVPKKKWTNWWIRFFWTFVMIFGFITTILAGPLWLILLVMVIQTQVFREVISIAEVPSNQQNLTYFRSLSLYFLFATNYFLYGESVIFYVKPLDLLHSLLLPLATHHRLISFLLYCAGLVMFVLNLKKGLYKFQFSHFGWTHMTLLLVVVQSHFIINNIVDGLFWFILPVLLVVCNDIMAYVFGFFFGRTPLISISPKKTWEGFLGAFLSTIIFGFLISGVMAKIPYLVCPPNSLTWSYFTPSMCVMPSVFVVKEYALPPALATLLKLKTVTVAPVQWHALVLAAFSSSIAPFGGFFASGVKRAFDIKDFGDSIPGHGGLTDRMDCQLLMGLFSNIYFQSFIRPSSIVTISTVLHTILTKLSIEDQLELYHSLKESLMNRNLITS